MGNETFTSVGIDIGTTTTQVVFSRMTAADTGGYGMAPNIQIISKEIVYTGAVHFTPLRSEDEIDANAVRELILAEYINAGYMPRDVATGAVIVTGETARKRNASAVAAAVSDLAGDFVVASAGPDMEGVLAGKGSGAALLSEKTGKTVANLDVGGGTTNICCFRDGRTLSQGCYDIGGRLITTHGDKIEFIDPGLRRRLREMGIRLDKDDRLDRDTVLAVCALMAEILCRAAGLLPVDGKTRLFETNHGIDPGDCPELFTFSGGVADCVYGEERDDFQYGDIGVLLGRALKNSAFFREDRVRRPAETLRATVIGAGVYSLELSGSTVEYKNCAFPFKSIPVARVSLHCGQEIDGLEAEVIKKLRICRQNETGDTVAVAFEGIGCPGFTEVERMADALASAMRDEKTWMVITKTDMAKALGKALLRRSTANKALLCIDGIDCAEGGYLDVGFPVGGGKAVPVVVKTLIFSL